MRAITRFSLEIRASRWKRLVVAKLGNSTTLKCVLPCQTLGTGVFRVLQPFNALSAFMRPEIAALVELLARSVYERWKAGECVPEAPPSAESAAGEKAATRGGSAVVGFAEPSGGSRSDARVYLRQVQHRPPDRGFDSRPAAALQRVCVRTGLADRGKFYG